MLRSVARAIRPIAHRWGFDLVHGREYYELEAFRYSVRNAVDVIGMAMRDLIRERGSVQFVQIGANDGLRDDDFRRFIEGYELSGLLIEPQAEAFQRLAGRYAGNPRLILENCAIAPRTGSLKLYALQLNGDEKAQTDQFTSFDRKIIEQVRITQYTSAEIIEMDVPSYTLADLLAKHSLKYPDVLVIDTEGYDFEILKSIDLVSQPPALIQMEHVNLPAVEKHQALEYLVHHGYRLAFQQGEIIALADGESASH